MRLGTMLLIGTVAAYAGMARADDKPRPPAPQCSRIYAPVCGVDKRTYGNACEAGLARVSVASTGPCRVCDPTDGSGCSGASTVTRNSDGSPRPGPK